MKKRIKVLLAVFLVISFMAMPNQLIYASEGDSAEGLKILSYSIPDEAKEYAYEIAPAMLSTVINNEQLYGVTIDRFEDLTLGEPYTVANFENDSNDKDVYYFPILEKDKVKLVLSVTKVSEQWNATIGEDIAEELNNINSSKEYILYYDDGTTYAETEDGKETLFTDPQMKSEDTPVADDMSFEEKVEKCTEKNGQELNVSEQSDNAEDEIGEQAIQKSNEYSESIISDNDVVGSEAYFGAGAIDLPFAPVGAHAANPFSILNNLETLLNVDECLVNQQDSSGQERGMCWAASVATIVRYMKGNNTLTASDICHLMGIDYDVGGTLDDMLNALTKYGLSYRLKEYHSTWKEITNNIKNKKPIGMAAASYDGGHAVTLIGFSAKGRSRVITLWNSGNQRIQSSTFKSDWDDVTFNYNSTTWYWTDSFY